MVAYLIYINHWFMLWWRFFFYVELGKELYLDKIDAALEDLSVESAVDLQKVLKTSTFTSRKDAFNTLLANIHLFQSRLGAMLFLISALLSRELFSTCFHEDCSSGKQSFHFDLIVLSGNCEFITLASNNEFWQALLHAGGSCPIQRPSDVLMRYFMFYYHFQIVHELQGYLME
ncbi:hypothetical protein ACJX0J_040605 [Zea mays]